MDNELVLAVPADSVNQLRTYNSETFIPDGTGLLGSTILKAGGHRWLFRKDADMMPEFKQVIPYCVVHYRDAILSYQRGSTGGEERLHELRSIGFGGHIDPVDTDYDMVAFTRNEMFHAVRRELHEELIYDEDISIQLTPRVDVRTWYRFRGIINDNSNDVGRVHVGFVFDVDLCTSLVDANEDCISRLMFQSIDSLEATKQHYETWSQACIENLRDIVHLP